jgi:hypothetical protein
MTSLKRLAPVLLLGLCAFPLNGGEPPPQAPDPAQTAREEIKAWLFFHRFRDRWLQGTLPGRWITDFYYHHSPLAGTAIDSGDQGDRYPDRVLLRQICFYGVICLGTITPLGIASGMGILLLNGTRRLWQPWPRPKRTAALAGAALLFLAAASLHHAPPGYWRLRRAQSQGDASTLLELLGHPRVGTRAEAALAACLTSHPSLLPRLREMLARDPGEQVRFWAATALALEGAPEDIPRICAALQDPAYHVRSRAARALRMYGERLRWLKERSPQAALGLQRTLQNARVTDHLYQAFNREEMIYVRNELYWAWNEFSS